ncbi:MAG: sensor histidine kinase [Dehalococcoidales bacterium]|nr:sensor histidine kinase [Dehalococcoidales bacterium]
MRVGLNWWREGGLLLGLVRGLALLLAVTLFIFFTKTQPFPFWGYLLIGLVSVYTISRIVFPFYWYGRARMAYVILAADILICCALPFVKAGSISLFILYPLTVVLSAALFFPQKTAYIIATIGSISAVTSQILALQGSGTALLPIQLYIALMAIYVIVAYLIAWLPYVANINFSATIKHRAILEERFRLSRELHDGPAQRLAALIMRLETIRDAISDKKEFIALAHLSSFKRELQDAHLEVREVIDQLRVRIPDNLAMLPTLAQYTRDFSKDTGIPCHVYLSDGYTELNPLTTVEVLRVVQEALTNVKKHSEASEVELKFESKHNSVKMIIKDNGRGFNLTASDRHHGISVMKERVQSVGGHMEINSSPGKGTEIDVTIPTANSPGGNH